MDHSFFGFYSRKGDISMLELVNLTGGYNGDNKVKNIEDRHYLESKERLKNEC